MMPRFVNVAVPRPLWQTYTYSVPPQLAGGELVGRRALVPFGKDRLVGVVWDEDREHLRTDPEPKTIIEMLDSAPPLPDPVMELVRWASRYYHAPPGMMFSGVADAITLAARLVGANNP